VFSVDEEEERWWNPKLIMVNTIFVTYALSKILAADGME
jgi:hypothetical protein